MYLREIRELPGLTGAADDGDLVGEMRDSIEAGDAWIVRRAFDADRLLRIRDYLIQIGRSSLPNWEPIVKGAPNFHRVYADDRSYVKGRFHQWSFFPWNCDVFGLFDFFRPAYHLNNRINGWEADAYLGLEPERDCIARLTFQQYPRGIGHIRRHEDAVGPHKFTTVMLALSAKGVDYRQGGAYLARGDDGGDYDLDADLAVGDLVLVRSNVEHGVDPIDPEVETDWLAFEGKWTLILAVNKLAGTTSVPDSKQVGS